MSRSWPAVITRPLRHPATRTALRGSSWALTGTFVGRVANVGALLLAARLLGSEQFGGLSLALSTTLVVTSVSALGLPVAAQKLVAESRVTDPARRDRLIDLTIGLTASVGLVTMAAAVVLGGWVADRVLGQPEVGPLIALASLLVLATPMVEILAALLAALERFAALGWFRAAHGCACGVALVVTLVEFRTAEAALGALVAGELAGCGIGILLVRRARGPRVAAGVTRSEFVANVAALLRVSMPALVAGVSLQPAFSLGQVLLSRQPDGLEHVGAFAVAMRWQSIALFVPATMGLVLLPMLGRLRATGHVDDARDLFVRYGVLTLVVSTVTGAAVVALARPLLGLQGADYSTATAVLIVLAVAVVPTALNNVLSNRAVAEGRIALWLWSDLALSATLAAGAVLLVPLFDGTGLALAYLAGYLATCAVLLPVALAARSTAGRPV